MKKTGQVLLIILLAVLLATPVVAATLAGTTVAAHRVSEDKRDVMYAYSLPSVAVSTTQIFSIETPVKSGKILSWLLFTASLDCDFYINTRDEQTISQYTVIAEPAINITKGRTDIIPFFNRDPAQVEKLYPTIKNDDTVNATGISYLIITFRKGSK